MLPEKVERGRLFGVRCKLLEEIGQRIFVPGREQVESLARIQLLEPCNLTFEEACDKACSCLAKFKTQDEDQRVITDQLGQVVLMVDGVREDTPQEARAELAGDLYPLVDKISRGEFVSEDPEQGWQRLGDEMNSLVETYGDYGFGRAQEM